MGRKTTTTTNPAQGTELAAVLSGTLPRATTETITRAHVKTKEAFGSFQIMAEFVIENKPADLMAAPLLHHGHRPWGLWLRQFGLEAPPQQGRLFDDSVMLLEAAAQGIIVEAGPRPGPPPFADPSTPRRAGRSRAWP